MTSGSEDEYVQTDRSSNQYPPPDGPGESPPPPEPNGRRRLNPLDVIIAILVILAIGIAALLVGTAPNGDTPPVQPTTTTPTLTITPTPTTTPTPTATPTTTPPTPFDPEDLPDVLLPEEDEQDLIDVAIDKGITPAPLARENTVIYALPPNTAGEGNPGAVFFLTPVKDPPGFSSKEIAADPSQFANQMIGGLTVVKQVNGSLPPLPPDDYVITLSADGNSLVFTGRNSTQTFDAVIRRVPTILTRTVALITSSQVCISWQVTQLCALMDNPLPSDLVTQIREAIATLPADQADFALDRSIPDVEGLEGLKRCASALNPTPVAEAIQAGQPEYENCLATVLAAPTVKDIAFKVPTVPGSTMTGIGLLLALEDIKEEIFVDANLTSTDPISPSILPKDDYLVIEVVLSTDPEISPGIFERRVQLLSSSSEFFIPILTGGVLIGTPLQGTGPSGDDEAVIANLWLRGRRCIFKFRQCRWLR